MNTSKKVTLTIGTTDVKFAVEMSDYNDFVNAMASGGDKIAPSHNFCVNSVVKDDEAKLLEILQGWGAGISIAGSLIGETQDTVTVSVKKLKSEPNPSSKTN